MTKRIPKFPDDPGIAEVRRWRAQIVKEAGGTLRGLMKFLRESEANRAASDKRPRRSRRKSA
jgi:hypothetical protein